MRRSSDSFRAFRILVPGSLSNLGCGFDALGLAVSLYFKTCVRPSPKFHLETSHNGRTLAIPPEENLFLKVLRSCYPISPDDWHFAISIDSEVPPRRGLGSSACAIVSALHTAARLQKLPMDASRTVHTAMQWEAAPDGLCAAVHGGFMTSMMDEGGKLSYLPLPFPEHVRILLLIPQWEVSTQEARRLLPQLYPQQAVVANLQRLAFFLASMVAGDLRELRESVRDQIHQPYRVPLIPFARDLLDSDAFPPDCAIFISGSGPTFAVCYRTRERRIRSAIQKIMANHGIPYELCPVQIDREGARIESLED